MGKKPEDEDTEATKNNNNTKKRSYNYYFSSIYLHPSVKNANHELVYELKNSSFVNEYNKEENNSNYSNQEELASNNYTCPLHSIKLNASASSDYCKPLVATVRLSSKTPP